jgi:DNA-binding beta-propeller fold protein YncE
MRRSVYGLAAVLALSTALTVPSAASAATAGTDCPQWTMSTVASGLGLPLENLAFDGRGGLLVSATLYSGPLVGKIDQVTPDGQVSTPIPNVNGPGAIETRGSTVYYTTGHNTISGLLGLTDGTIDTLDLDTGRISTWATGLTMPDGMALLPDGDAVTSDLIGPKTGVSLVRRSAPNAPVVFGPNIPGPNGLAVSNDGRTLYVASSLNPFSQVYEIDLANPYNPEPRTLTIDASIWPATFVDDLTVGRDGMLYTVGEHGNVYRIDPDTGASCAIAHNDILGSSVRFGAGPGWDPASLYSTGFDGTVRRLTPPSTA